MKTLFLPQRFFHRSRRITVLILGLILLSAPLRVVLAQTFTTSGLAYGTNINTTTYGLITFVTNIYNFFDYNGTTTSSDGLDPANSVPFGGDPGFGPLPFPIIDGSVAGTIPLSLPVIVTGTAVAGSYANFTLGNNPTAGGMTVYLSNPNSAADEVRLDWSAVYVYTGPPITAFNPFVANIQGNLTAGSYYALAGGETIYDGTQTNSTTAILDNSFNSPVTVPYLGTGPWYGSYPAASPFNVNAMASFALSHGGLLINSGDFVEVVGYLDLVVDPGTVQVRIQTVQPPTLGIGTYSNQPVIFFPTASGTNFVVEMSTNLASTNWVPVTNGVPFGGLQVTNAPSPGFFRLH